MLIRYCKIALVASSFLFLFLVVFNNLFDYGSNYAFVEAVLSMNTTFEGNAGMWRAIESPIIHHLFYWSIILWEAISMVLIGWGALALFKNKSAGAAAFNKAKAIAAAGLTLSMLQWYIAFLTVGAEWFLMWQSKSFNGQDAAMRMFVVMGISLIFLMMKDDEISD
jgi:predicted small integral membrane protein